MPNIRLIGLDVDGTLVDPDPYHLPVHVPQAAQDAIAAAAGRGVRFAIVTGRNLAEIEPIFAPGGLPLAPFAAFISDERDVWWIEAGKPRLDEAWSAPLRERERSQLDVCVELLEEALPECAPEGYELVNLGDVNGRCYVGAALRGDADVKRALTRLRARLAETDLPLTTLRNGRWIALRHRDTGKGAALAYAAERLGIPPGEVLAVGDSGNDASMLHGYGFVPGTTANADAEIKALVGRQGGQIASQARGDGVAELIERLVLRGADGPSLSAFRTES